MRLAKPALALAVLAGGALIAVPSLLRAADESPHDAVEKLMPQLLSDDDAVRSDAEKKLFALGEPGRADVERMTRDADPRRAITALRLLQSRGWTKTQTGKALADGEQRVHRRGEATPRGEREDDPIFRLDDLQAQIDRQMAELRKQFEGLDRGFTLNGPGVDFDFDGKGFHGSSNGTVVENDKKTTWSIDEDGRVKVTIQDGKDAPEQTFEAKTLDELKKDHPDVAKRIENLVGRSNRRTFTLRMPQFRMDGDLDPRRAAPLVAAGKQVLGVEWSPVPDVLREQLDLPSGGMVVESVVTGSLAEKLGVARFDVIVEMQGKSVADSGDVRKALADVKDGESVKAVVLRKGQRKTLEATK